jgi:hypothetical protein
MNEQPTTKIIKIELYDFFIAPTTIGTQMNGKTP